jgi:hypothetical protein
MIDLPPNPLIKPGYQLEFHDEFDFDSNTLNTSKWIPYYLPQWSSREQSTPRYAIGDSKLTLRILAEQQTWCP